MASNSTIIHFKHILAILLLSLISHEIKAQLLKPNHPTITYLTIDISNGQPTIYWSKEDFSPLCEPTTGYIIYRKSTDGNCVGNNCAIDTVASNVFFYTDINANGNLGQLTYNVATLGTTQTSQLWIAHSNIFIESYYDSCNHKIDLTWKDNDYQGWGNRIKNYNIYLQDALGSYQLYTSIPGTSKSVNILNVVENREYNIYVEATKDTSDSGVVPYVTRSGLFHKITTMPTHPTSMAIDSIIAEDDRINLYFKIDTSTRLTDFEIVRWEDSDSIKSIFSAKMIHKFSNPSKTYFADTVDSWTARTRPFYYKIDALNSCPTIVKTTNHTNSIIPVIHNEGMINNIQWNELFIDSVRKAKGDYARYRIIRYAYTDVPLPPVYLPETDQLEITDDVQGFEGQGYSIEFCYQVEGFERNISGAIATLSRSRIQCTEVVPGVTMPNAIIPTDSYVNNGNARNILIPIITFTANYTLSVYNRWGNLIFNGENEGWNGRIAGGQWAKEGAYIYRLVVHTTENHDVVKIGNVTVIYP